MYSTREVTLVLVTPDGSLVGSLPSFSVASQWWQEAEPVVAEAKRIHDVDVTILRLLAAERDAPPGGAITYLAEVAHPVSASPWPEALDDHALRLPWAKAGGPADDVDWAIAVLAESGRELDGLATASTYLESLQHLATAGFRWVRLAQIRATVLRARGRRP